MSKLNHTIAKEKDQIEFIKVDIIRKKRMERNKDAVNIPYIQFDECTEPILGSN